MTDFNNNDDDDDDIIPKRCGGHEKKKLQQHVSYQEKSFFPYMDPTISPKMLQFVFPQPLIYRRTQS